VHTYGVPQGNLKPFLCVTNSGEEIKLKPYSGALNIDFGKGVRKKNVTYCKYFGPNFYISVSYNLQN
jgi:hypothetical protein